MEQKYPKEARIQIVRDPTQRGIIETFYPHSYKPLYGIKLDSLGNLETRHFEDEIEPEGTPLVWRDDAKRTDTPTVSMFVIHAKDDIGRQSIYTLSIKHVNTFPRGRGFVAGVWSAGSGGNGEVHLGQSQLSYDAAVTEGRAMLERMCKELDESMKRSERVSKS